MKVILSHGEFEIIKQILIKHLPEDTCVWAFGSRARGNPKKFSDLDLAIDSHGMKLPLSLIVELNDELDESDLPFKVDVLDWNDISERFRANIRDSLVDFLQI